MQSIILTVSIALLCGFIITSLSVVISELFIKRIKKDKNKRIVLSILTIVYPISNFFIIIIAMLIFGIGVNAMIATYICLQVPLTISMYCNNTRDIPKEYYDVCKEFGSNPITTFILPLYFGKIKNLFLINFMLIYNDYLISKSMYLTTPMIQNAIAMNYDRIIFYGYSNYIVLILLSIVPPIITIKVLSQDCL